MTTYRELLAQVKEEIAEIDAARLAEELGSATPPLLIDVREPDEYEQGAIAEAVHIPRGFLESRIEAAAPDKGRRIVLSCASGARSAFGAKALAELGYTDVVSLAGEDGREFARGLVNYPEADLRRIAGLKTEQIAGELGYCPYDEVVHRDNLAVIRRDQAPS